MKLVHYDGEWIEVGWNAAGGMSITIMEKVDLQQTEVVAEFTPDVMEAHAIAEALKGMGYWLDLKEKAALRREEEMR